MFLHTDDDPEIKHGHISDHFPSQKPRVNIHLQIDEMP